MEMRGKIKRIIENKELMRRAFWAWLVTLFILALIPRFKSPELDLTKDFKIRFDYIAHFIFYIGLSTLFTLWKREEILKMKRTELFRFFILGLFTATITEYFHKFLPQRSFNYIDLGLNYIGLTLGLVLIAIYYRKAKRRLKAINP